MMYKPGLHVLGELKTSSINLLVDAAAAQGFVDNRIDYYSLHKLADHYHSFGENSGFTGIVCLTESHISLHTWPEFGYLTIDIYLSNYEQVNNGKAQAFFDDCIQYFECSQYNKTELNR